MRTIVRDRSLVQAWLLGARRAQIALGLTLVLGLFVFPPIRDAIVDAVLPEQTARGGFLGLSRRSREHPLAGPTRTVLTSVFWLGGLGATATLLVLRAPHVTGRRPEDPGGSLELQQTMLPGPGAEPEADWSAASKVPETATVAARAAPPAPPPADGAAWSAAPEAAPAGPGGRYQIDEELGRGAMGVVYRARDTVLEREVALKELPSRLVRERSLAERFRIEARALAKLTHPGIVQVYDLVENDAGMWIAMELVSGGSLDAPLEQGSPPLGEALRLGAEMADALAHAHSQGVVHRDFKPHNVLLTPEGRPKITDFGLAKVAREGPKLTQVGAIMGSPAYMSPEQAAGGDIDHRADAYAFGATLYQMLVGRCPFEGNTASILAAHITQPAPDPADFGVELPAALRTLLASLLAKEPADRPNDLAVVAEELRRVVATLAS